jgi:hypothetical protein
MNERVRNYLIEVAKKKGIIHYQNLCDACDLGLDMSQSEDRNKIAKILGNISKYEYQNGRPLLSAIVLHKKTFDVGKGFFDMCQERGIYCGTTKEQQEKMF